MKITPKWLIEQSACSEGVEWFSKYTGKTEAASLLKSLMAEEKHDWANWLIERVMSRKQKLQYAIYAAEQVIGIYEKKYPDDDRPRTAIDAAKAVLKNDTKKNRAAARAAGDAGEKIQTKILNYGISLLEKTKKPAAA